MTRVALKMTENELQQLIIDAAHATGWLVYHTHDSRHSQPGFPDLVLVRGRHLRFVELKTDTGRVSDHQARWIAALAGVTERPTVEVWRPNDLDRALRELSTPIEGRPR